jgi:hypothetical protein
MHECHVYASPEKLHAWLGRETAGEPVHIATEEIEPWCGLKRGLSFIRQQRRKESSKKKAG